MRGKIIHYNGNDGRGLIAAGERQFAFDVSLWRSDSAPAINQTVEITLVDDSLTAVQRVSEETLVKEKVSNVAGLGVAAAGAALQSLKDKSPNTGGLNFGVLGKPLLIAQAVFAIGALFCSFITIDMPGVSLGKSLVDLSELSGQLGSSVGGAFWAWVGILSFAVPLFWRNRLAWLALFLPAVATVLPMVSLLRAAHQADVAMGSGMNVSNGILNMINPGLGAGLCAVSALFLAVLGFKRFAFPPSR